MTDAYAAGILDGEGSISIAKQDDYYTCRVSVGMSDKGYPVLEFLKREYGGHISGTRASSGNSRESKQWRTSGHNAISFLRRVQPHLRLKACQAEIAFQMGDLVAAAPKRPNGRKKWSPEMRSKAEVLKRRMNEANQRGTGATFAPLPTAGAVAVFQYGEWMEPEPDLFGPVPFKGKLPMSGSLRGGSLIPRKSLRESAVPARLLPTPAAMNPNDGESLESWEARRLRTKERVGNGNGFGTPLAIAVQKLC